MDKFIQELRRRSVFRVAGIYVGVSWILIEVASVLLPTFDAPVWVLRWMFIVGFIGFPVALVIAWVYELTEEGLVRDDEVTESSHRVLSGRSRDLIAIGVLTVALIFSVYLNISGNKSAVEQREPVSVLIADFINLTGNALFDGSLEQALNIGVEGAPFITSFSRPSALAEAKKLGLGEALTGEVAQLMSVRQGIGLVLAGTIEPAGGGFKLAVTAIDPATGETVASVSTNAKATTDVLAAIGILSEEMREALGDDSIGHGADGAVEMFTAASLEAARDYARAQDLALAGKHEEALAYYEKAVEQDPNFARALSGWALSLFNLGRKEEATALWDRALTHMNTMTERERFRTLGLYYMVVTGNFEKAKESYQSLVEKYPADGPGHNNLAIAHFATLDFESALVEGRRVLNIYPTRTLFRSNYALYAMYAGDFATAETEARITLESDPSRYVAWLPVAMAALSRGEYPAAQEAYRQMAESGPRGKSVANLGLADIELYLGNFQDAFVILSEGIAHDEEIGNKRAKATKLVALAEAHIALGENTEANESLNQALEITGGLARQVPAALFFLDLGEPGKTLEIESALQQSVQAQSRAYGLMMDALLQQHGKPADIGLVNKLREALSVADLWLIRFELAKAYLQNGYFAEALDELTACEARRGEATSLYLDDLPTWRYMATLPYWKGRAQQELGIDAARASFEEFLALRPAGGALAEDARGRLQ